MKYFVYVSLSNNFKSRGEQRGSSESDNIWSFLKENRYTVKAQKPFNQSNTNT